MSQEKVRTLLASVAATLLLLSACSGTVSNTGTGTGAVSGSGSGGNSTGASSTGGGSGTGGAAPVTPGSGGVASTGGNPGSGGAASTGGRSGGSGRDAGAVDAPVVAGTGGSAGGTTDAGSTVEAATQLCVDTINMYRATLGLAPYARWTAQETCTSREALLDSQSGTAHSAFGMCTENAQNECPGWSGSLASIVTGCLAQMWAEGPGTDFATHGHYINMSNTRYTMAACGFATAANGRIWAAQNFR